MYVFGIDKKDYENNLYFFLLFLYIFLPFQFALNLFEDYDVAIMRVMIPVLFLLVLFFHRKAVYIALKEKSFKQFFIFFLLIVVSLFHSQNILWSLRKILFLVSLFPIYLVTLSLLTTYKRKCAAVSAIIIAASLLAFISITQFTAQFIFGIDKVYGFLAQYSAPFFLGKAFSSSVLAYPSWLVNSQGITYMRAVGLFPDPHMLSYYLGLLIPWSIALTFDSSKKINRYFFCTILLIIADVSTFTRSGYLALIAGAFVIIPLVSKKARIKIFASALFLAGLYFIAPSNAVAGRLAASFDMHEGSNIGRLSNWNQAIFIIKKNPLGVGIGNYSLSVNPAANYRQPIYAHSLYMDVAAEIGIPAALLLIAILITAFTNFWKAAYSQPLFIAGVSSITIFAVQSVVETPIYSVHVLPLILIIIALSSSIKNYETP